MKRGICLIILLIGLSILAQAQTLRKRAATLMGSPWEISIVAKDSASAEKYIDTVIAEVSRIERLISDWIPSSQVSEVNRMAGIAPVHVDPELLALTRRALRFSRITQGAFDVSFAAMDRIWKFDGSMTEMPSPEAVRKSVEKVGYQNIIIDTIQGTIFLKLPGMKIGFGALGEGYAADRCRELMLSKGIRAGIVNGSGDMSLWGRPPNGKLWNIGITDPFHPDELYAVLPVEDAAVTTSGSYEKFVMFNGKRYSHIINPATGYPVTGLCSVTVLGPSTEMANGFSTSIMVMGREAGLKLLEQYPAYRCIIVSDEGKFYCSPSIPLKKHKVRKNK